MRPSELWRRGIVLPLNAAAASQIAGSDIDDNTEVDYLPIEDDDLFHQLLEIGLLNKINRACSTMIDEYEAEWLPSEQLPAAKAVVASLLWHRPSGEIAKCLHRLAAMIDRAVAIRMPLYFEL